MNNRSQRYRWTTPDASNDTPPAETRPHDAALTRNWNNLTRYQQIAVRHKIYDQSAIPNDEYTASWYDVKVLLDANITLVEALRNLVPADNCNYSVEAMRSEGYFDAARKALADAGAPYEPYEVPRAADEEA